MKDLIVLGGPNGAGKSTAATMLLPAVLGIQEFVNADAIAKGLSPFNPKGAAFAAGRLMVARVRQLLKNGESFAFETTCAGLSHLQLLRRCRVAGYRNTLLFLWLPSPEAALARVARRVRAGGHDVDKDIVIRRYAAGLRNMRQMYLPIVDVGLVYDNSDGAGALVARFESGQPVAILDPMIWRLIEDSTR